MISSSRTGRSCVINEVDVASATSNHIGARKIIFAWLSTSRRMEPKNVGGDNDLRNIWPPYRRKRAKDHIKSGQIDPRRPNTTNSAHSRSWSNLADRGRHQQTDARKIPTNHKDKSRSTTMIPCSAQSNEETTTENVDKLEKPYFLPQCHYRRRSANAGSLDHNCKT